MAVRFRVNTQRRIVEVLVRSENPEAQEPIGEWECVPAPTLDLQMLNQLADESSGPQDFIERLRRVETANE